MTRQLKNIQDAGKLVGYYDEPLFEVFYHNLEQLLRGQDARLIEIEKVKPVLVRFETEGFISLAQFEEIETNEFNPEVLFEVIELKPGHTCAVPVRYIDDTKGYVEEIARYNDLGEIEYADLELRDRVAEFCSLWFRELMHQGFFRS